MTVLIQEIVIQEIVDLTVQHAERRKDSTASRYAIRVLPVS